MSIKKTIKDGRWWSKAWSLVDGCTPVSAGCDNCWSAAMAHRFKQGLTDNVKFNGAIKIREDNLELPLKTKKPTVFSVWNDLFHGNVPTEFIAKAFEVMVFCRYTCKKQHEHDGNCETEEKTEHTYLILTKRPQRMQKFLNDLPNYVGRDGVWPPTNIWLGTSIENQQTADERIPHLLQIPGKKFLSIEPLLGIINLHQYFWTASGAKTNSIQQVVCSGETGHNARPCHPDWVRSIRDQCQTAGVPYFFKGWGKWIPTAGLDAEYHSQGDKYWRSEIDHRTHDDLAWR